MLVSGAFSSAPCYSYQQLDTGCRFQVNVEFVILISALVDLQPRQAHDTQFPADHVRFQVQKAIDAMQEQTAPV